MLQAPEPLPPPTLASRHSPSRLGIQAQELPPEELFEEALRVVGVFESSTLYIALEAGMARCKALDPACLSSLFTSYCREISNLLSRVNRYYEEEWRSWGKEARGGT